MMLSYNFIGDSANSTHYLDNTELLDMKNRVTYERR